MHDLIKPIGDMYQFNSLTVGLALGDLKDQDANRRARNGKGSSIGYLVGHLLSSRYGVLKMLGASDENPYADGYGQNVEPKDENDIARMKTDWESVSVQLASAVENASAEQLMGPCPDGFPVEDRTLRGAIMFLAWHETYHIGQIGVLRTEYGYPSVQAQIHEALKMD